MFRWANKNDNSQIKVSKLIKKWKSFENNLCGHGKYALWRSQFGLIQIFKVFGSAQIITNNPENTVETCYLPTTVISLGQPLSWFPKRLFYYNLSTTTTIPQQPILYLPKHGYCREVALCRLHYSEVQEDILWLSNSTNTNWYWINPFDYLMRYIKCCDKMTNSVDPDQTAP